MVKSTGIAPMPLQDLEVKPIRLDFGCGTRTRIDRDISGNITMEFEGVDILDFGQKHIVDLKGVLPWDDCSVAEAHTSHFIEHLGGDGDREQFLNEAYRILEWGAKMTVVAPHWSNDAAYGDPSHKWPPMSSWSHLYWNAAWRAENAPHTKYTCDFDPVGVTFSPDPVVSTRAQEFQQFAASHYRNGVRDIVYHLVKTKRS